MVAYDAPRVGKSLLVVDPVLNKPSSLYPYIGGDLPSNTGGFMGLPWPALAVHQSVGPWSSHAQDLHRSRHVAWIGRRGRRRIYVWAPSLWKKSLVVSWYGLGSVVSSKHFPLLQFEWRGLENFKQWRVLEPTDHFNPCKYLLARRYVHRCIARIQANIQMPMTRHKQRDTQTDRQAGRQTKKPTDALLYVLFFVGS